MKRIQLTRGQFALVDDADFDYLNQWKWHALFNPHCKSFAAVRLTPKKEGRKLLYMHRVITKATKGKEVDHINHDQLNNQRENLRLCTASENSRNRRKRSDNKIGFKGVSQLGKSNSFFVRIRLKGKTVFYQSFKDKIQAARKYNEVAKNLFGDFALLNEV